MSSFTHVLAGFTLGYRHRQQLAQLMAATELHSSILSIDPNILKTAGITALALDFDGVLAAHGAASPLPEAIDWLKKCADVFGGKMIFILSNKPTEARRQWFAENFPAISFIAGVRKKPYPDGIIKAGELAGVPLSQLLMVDDRLLTGCLAAILAGATPYYIRQPYVAFNHRTVAELFFQWLRMTERLFVRLITCF